MKVLERGDIAEKWKMQYRCTGWNYSNKGCHALLEIEFDDVYYFQGGGVPDTWGYSYKEPSVSFKCPCCGSITGIGKAYWPEDYRRLKIEPKEWSQNFD
jgi:hypothetical protein